MRWIVLVLLFANAGYFAWGYYHQSHKSYRAVKVDSEVLVQAGKRLVLLSEVTSQMPGRMLESQALEENTQAQCLVVGPFEFSAEADRLQQKLFSLGVSSRERSDNEVVLADYWVHIPPRSNRQAAIRLLRDLQRQGIDSFVITQGELANGISLGLFSKEVSANEVSRRVQEAGYEPAIKKLPREPETFWLEMTESEANKLSTGFWEKQANQYSDLKMLEKNCKSVASNDAIH
ncbi:hypothetical protein [Endozoicomonas sp. 4G]|uniref:SPOR domain-containing protein n=1 Tax=Endozoicomonas sp. 4G TaxID=2872754 RepID=UPI0020787869|nr:hypothetical protein [Endozoicomonas sp. 4G]